MTQATIIRCPNTPSLRSYAAEVAARLRGQDVLVELFDGEAGEFRLLLDGDSYFTRKDEPLPPVENLSDGIHEAGLMRLAI